jgi:CubicO group peptidase (beta-lactamase class C family)
VRISLRVLLLVLLCFTGIAQAQAPQETVPKVAAPQSASQNPVPTVPANVPHILEHNDLEAFFDGILPLQLERSDVAGTSVLVMKDGQVLLQKGYGYSDWAKKKPVDPETTMFRLASISKLFTWISVMQLVEQGKLNIDADINQYLDFLIVPAFGQPITLRNLMTHTGGFEEEIRDLLAVNPKNPPTLREFLMQNQPRRIYPPGQVPAYSNYGVGLAGYIVQRVSGEPFENYVEEHVFQPLGMAHSSFRQPLPPVLITFVSDGYRSNTEKPPLGFEILNPTPAGGLSSTAPDMGRFAQMLLNGGQLEGHQILKPETLAQMWTRQFAASDHLPAMCMGFYQVWRNGLHFIGHEGDLIAFHSLFFLEPKEKLVLFVSYNSAGSASKTRDELLRAFADRYYPYTLTPNSQKPSADDLRAMAGTYESTRRADTTKMKMSELFGYIHGSVNEKEGELRLTDFENLRGHEQKWKPGDDGLWHEEDGQDVLYGIRDSQGKVVRLAFDFPGQQLQRVPWYETDRFVLSLGGASLAILATVVLAVLLRLLRSIFLPSRAPWEPQPRTLRLTFAPRAAAFAWIALFGYLAILANDINGPDSLLPTHDSDKYFVICNAIAALAVFLSIFAFAAGLRIWRRKELRPISQVKFTLVALACVFLTWFSIHWNILGPAHRF